MVPQRKTAMAPVVEDDESPEDLLDLIERVRSDSDELRRVLDRETDLVADGDWTGVQMLTDEKRWYGDRVHVHLSAVRHRRQAMAALGEEALAALIESQTALAESSRRNALALSRSRELKQRVVDVIAEVAREKGCPVTVYGSNGRAPALRAAARAAPVNINGQF